MSASSPVGQAIRTASSTEHCAFENKESTRRSRLLSQLYTTTDHTATGSLQIDLNQNADQKMKTKELDTFL